MRAPYTVLAFLPLAWLGAARGAAAQPEAAEAPDADAAQAEASAATNEARVKPPAHVARLWLDAELGVTSMDMGAMKFAYGGYGSSLVPGQDDGLALQVTAGGRYRFLTFGARACSSLYPAYPIHVLGGEVGVQWPVRWVEPRIQLHAGYAFHGPADVDLPDPGLSGPAFGGGAGLRFHVGRFLVLGVDFDMDLMWLTGKIRLAREGPGVDPIYNAAYQRQINLGLLPSTARGQGYQLRTLLSVGVRLW